MNFLSGGLLILQSLPYVIQAIMGIEQAFAAFGAKTPAPVAPVAPALNAAIVPPPLAAPKLGAVKKGLVMAAFAGEKPAQVVAISRFIDSSVEQLNLAGVFSH